MDLALPFVLAQETASSVARLPGFLGTRGSFMLDFVFAAMFGILVALAWSIYVVRVQRNYQLHKRIQLTLGIVLLVAVAAFEIDMRFFTDWEALARPSRFYREGTWDLVWTSLAVHLLFAIPTTVIWLVVIVQALRKFPSPPTPGPHSASHRFWGWIAAFEMLMTSVTGWIFYVIAFVM